MSKPAPGVPAPIPFNFNSTEVRIVMRDGQPWFVAQDVCKALGYSNSRKAIADHLDDDERCNQSLHRGGEQTIINESGLYALVLRSRKPEARKFAKWVTSEVLPSIRTTGQFKSEQAQPDIERQQHASGRATPASPLDMVLDGRYLVCPQPDGSHKIIPVPRNTRMLVRQDDSVSEIAPEACIMSAQRFLQAIRVEPAALRLSDDDLWSLAMDLLADLRKQMGRAQNRAAGKPNRFQF